MAARTRTLLIALAAASAAGVVFSGLLYYSSAEIAAGITRTSLCTVGDSMSCAPALSSKWGSLFGIPLPAWSGAYYFAILGGLLGVYFTEPSERDRELRPLVRFVAITYGLSVVSSVFLGYIAFIVLPMPCPFCIGLYVVNVLGLGLGIALKPDLGGIFKGLGASFKEQVGSGVVRSSVAVFVIALALSAASYSWTANRIRSASQESQRERGQEAADNLGEEDVVQLDTTGLPRLGPVDAPVVIVEFSDFECPFCSRFASEMHQVHLAYPEDVVIYFSHFPLDASCNPASGTMHPSACLGARATVCAQAQNKFWEMHDAVFGFFAMRQEQRSRSPLSEAALLKMAGEMGLNPEAFLACMGDAVSSEQLTEQIRKGLAAGITSTPAWFINGHRRKGAHSFAYMQPQIERLLEERRQALGLEDPPEASAAAASSSESP